MLLSHGLRFGLIFLETALVLLRSAMVSSVVLGLLALVFAHRQSRVFEAAIKTHLHMPMFSPVFLANLPCFTSHSLNADMFKELLRCCCLDLHLPPAMAMTCRALYQSRTLQYRRLALDFYQQYFSCSKIWLNLVSNVTATGRDDLDLSLAFSLGSHFCLTDHNGSSNAFFEASLQHIKQSGNDSRAFKLFFVKIVPFMRRVVLRKGSSMANASEKDFLFKLFLLLDTLAASLLQFSNLCPFIAISASCLFEMLVYPYSSVDQDVTLSGIQSQLEHIHALSIMSPMLLFWLLLGVVQLAILMAFKAFRDCWLVGNHHGSPSLWNYGSQCGYFILVQGLFCLFLPEHSCRHLVFRLLHLVFLWMSLYLGCTFTTYLFFLFPPAVAVALISAASLGTFSIKL